MPHPDESDQRSRGQLDEGVEAILDRSTPEDYEEIEVAALRDLERIARQFGEARRVFGIDSDDTPNDPTRRTSGRETSADDSVVALFHWGSLAVMEQIGEGSFGTVYRAFEPDLQREVVLKLSKRSEAGAEALRGYLLREARLLARVRHPNVVTVHGAGIQEGRVGIWTDWIRGDTLEARFEERGRCSAAELTALGIDLSAALGAVHAVGVVHGDVTPKNVMVEEGGRIVLLDFGSSRAPDDASSLTGTSGTPYVTPIEVLNGESPDPSCDLYALGVVLYRMASGRWPCLAANLRDLRQRLGDEQNEPLHHHRPDLPRELIAVVERALMARPDRFRTAQQMADALSQSLVPAKGVAASQFRLPAPLTRFVGRSKDLRSLVQRLETERWVTVTGAGGSGKTRLALEAARTLAERFPEGPVWVDLRTVRNAEDLLPAIHDALQLGPVAASLEGIQDRLGSTEFLLVLDNLEHLRSEVALPVLSILQECSRTRILGTSRIPVGAAGESNLVLGPLEIPSADPGRAESGSDATAERMAGIRANESVDLFLDRATSTGTPPIAEEQLELVVHICRRLDGLPLALELAAYRLRAFGLSGLLERLDKWFESLDLVGPSPEPTLGAVFDWSYELLDDAQRRLFRALSVFVGSWPLEDVEPYTEGWFPEEDVLAMHADLLSCSLVERTGDARFRMLEPVRQYARAKASELGETQRLQDRHLDRVLALTGAASLGLEAGQGKRWEQTLVENMGNFESAFHHGLGDPGPAPRSKQLIRDLPRFFFETGRYRKGLELFETWLNHPEARSDLPNRLSVSMNAGTIALRLGDMTKAARYLEDAVRLAEETGDMPELGRARHNLGTFFQGRGDFARAQQLYEQALSVVRNHGSGRQVILALIGGAQVASLQNHGERATVMFEEAEKLARELDWDRGLYSALDGLFEGAAERGEKTRAREIAQECLRLSEKLGDRYLVAHELVRAARMASEDDTELAESYARRALTIARDIEDPLVEGGAWSELANAALVGGRIREAGEALLEVNRIATKLKDFQMKGQFLHGAAGLLAAANRPQDAVRLLATEASLSGHRGRIGRDELERTRALLNQDEFEQALRDGSNLGLDEAAAQAEDLVLHTVRT